MQFERTKHAKTQMEESTAKFFGLINFLFTFRKAKSNTECTGQQKSDSFTTERRCSGSVINIFIFFSGLNLSTIKIKTTATELTNSKINETRRSSVLLGGGGGGSFNHSLRCRLLWDKQRNSILKKITAAEEALRCFKVAL